MALRSRLALLALLGVLLIPIAMSSLRGLTHVLTCAAEAGTPFSVIVPEDGPPTLTSATTIERGEEAGLCGGLTLDMEVAEVADDRLALTVPITNRTESEWRGSVALDLDGTTIPVDIGRIAPGATASDVVEVRLEPGTHTLNGSLLIGP